MSPLTFALSYLRKFCLDPAVLEVQEALAVRVEYTSHTNIDIYVSTMFAISPVLSAALAGDSYTCKSRIADSPVIVETYRIEFLFIHRISFRCSFSRLLVLRPFIKSQISLFVPVVSIVDRISYPKRVPKKFRLSVLDFRRIFLIIKDLYLNLEPPNFGHKFLIIRLLKTIHCPVRFRKLVRETDRSARYSPMCL